MNNSVIKCGRLSFYLLSCKEIICILKLKKKINLVEILGNKIQLFGNFIMNIVIF